MACAGAGAASAAPPCQIWRFRPKSCILERCPIQLLLHSTQIHPKLRAEAPSATTFSSSSFHPIHRKKAWPSMIPKASLGSVEYVVEPETNVKFEKDLTVPGCSSPMVLLGTGYREKVFAIIGVKVYAAGFYVSLSLQKGLSSWKGKSSADILEDSTLFKSIFQEPTEKSLKISLVRDVDGDTFWNALNDVISPRIKEPTTTDDSALSTFRNTFQGRPLKKGTVILLTWAEPSKMLVSIPLEGPPSTVDAVIESINVTASLFDAFFGESPVSPNLKASVANGLGTFLSSS